MPALSLLLPTMGAFVVYGGLGPKKGLTERIGRDRGGNRDGTGINKHTSS